jgi:serine protease Do
MASRIVIQHVSGAKANQIEQFPVEGLVELSMGRDPSCSMAFDSQRDDSVSRKHAVIRIENGDHFKLADLGSSNGTRVNGEAISGEVELSAGDVIELGAGGPKFTFDVQPRPPHFMQRTRFVAKNVAATRVLSPADIEAAAKAAKAAPEPAKAGIGRNTVIGMMTAQQSRTNRNWMYVLAGVLLLVAVGGGGLYYNNKIKAEEAAVAMAKQAEELKAQREAAAAAAAKQAAEMQAQKEAAEKAAQKAKEEHEAALKRAVGMSPQEIARKYGNAVVMIEVSWRLFDKQSGKPLYHKTVSQKDIEDTRAAIRKKAEEAKAPPGPNAQNPNAQRPNPQGPNTQGPNTKGPEKVDPAKLKKDIPAYVLLANGQVARWLTTDDENQTNMVVGETSSGTGFVINSQGYLLTNKHVAAGWAVRYEGDLDEKFGVAFDVREQRAPIIFVPNRQSELIGVLEGGPVFGTSIPPAGVGGPRHSFEGRNESLVVRFPGSPLRLSARLMRASVEADAALIKVDTQQPLTTVDLSDGNIAAVGEQVTVLGYPGFNRRLMSRAVINSTELDRPNQQVQIVPEPTVTGGNISLILTSAQRSGGVTTIGPGDAYQLTAATGAGNSGGPVFDRNGKVIAILTYGGPQQTHSHAIPIKFGIDLLKTQRTAPN